MRAEHGDGKLTPDSGLTSGDSWRFLPRQEAQIPIYRNRDREFRTEDVLDCTFALCDGHEAFITPIAEVRVPLEQVRGLSEGKECRICRKQRI
jgi:hypothetical protein